jgi:hypothetical protein
MRRLLLAAVLGAGLLAGVGSALGDVNPNTNPGQGRMLGAVLPANKSYSSQGAGNLKYHGGPVMHTNKVYSIYWVPSGYSVASGYTSLIDQYFSDVSADSGKSTNVYYTGTQYYDGSGNVQYSSSYGGSVIDSDALPKSGCSDSYTSVCLTDAQIQSEIQTVISRQGWTANSSTEFFMFTAKGIGSCYGSSCAFSQYCAYHSWIGGGSTAILYANMPYADTVPAACDAGYHPNNNDADATINVTSHEHNETITDQQLNAWYDRRGYENGDKCAWNFGTATGPTGAKYNQTINGHNYYLQQEWSNKVSGCALHA